MQTVAPIRPADVLLEQTSERPVLRRDMRCAVCGYGVIARRRPERCPMCGECRWDFVEWRLFTRTAAA